MSYSSFPESELTLTMAEHTPLSAKMLQVQTVMQSKLRQSNS
jgi:hypothetical protein